MAKGLPEKANAIGESRKTAETAAHSSLATANAWTIPGGRHPAKFGCQPIKLELYLHAHTDTANYVRVHSRHLGVYKEGRVTASGTVISRF